MGTRRKEAGAVHQDTHTHTRTHARTVGRCAGLRRALPPCPTARSEGEAQREKLRGRSSEGEAQREKPPTKVMRPRVGRPRVGRPRVVGG